MHRFGKCTIFMHNQAEKCGEMWHKTIPLLFCRKAYFVSTKILKRLSLGEKHLSMKMEKTLKGPNLIFHAVRSKKSDIGRNIRYSLCCQNGSSRILIANFASKVRVSHVTQKKRSFFRSWGSCFFKSHLESLDNRLECHWFNFAIKRKLVHGKLLSIAWLESLGQTKKELHTRDYLERLQLSFLQTLGGHNFGQIFGYKF